MKGLFILTILLILCCCNVLHAQNRYVLSSTHTNLSDSIAPLSIVFPARRLACKGNVQTFFNPGPDTLPANRNWNNKPLPVQKAPAITIHGNIFYNVDYRSYIDTPYAEKDVYYHTVQTYLDVTYKEQYPIRVYLTNRFSNSAFTRSFTDMNMQFSSNDFKNRIRQTIKNYRSPDVSLDSLQVLQRQLELKKLELGKLNGWSKDPATIQKLIEAKERELYGKKSTLAVPSTAMMDKKELYQLQQKKPAAPGLKSLLTSKEKPETDKPAADTTIVTTYERNKKKIDSLRQELAVLEEKYNRYRNQVASLEKSKNSNVDKATSIEDLQKEVQLRNVPDSALPAGYKTLWAIKSFGIGRTMVDYSELSAKNVSIMGVQVEYNPSYYLAFATGTINYRFRDFIVKNGSMPSQHLQLVRIGTGQKTGNNVIATWYTGKKQLYNNSGLAQATQPDYRLMGFTVEGNYKLNEAVYVTAEVAKSSLPYYNKVGTDKGLLASTLAFSDRTNEAYSLKLQSFIKRSGTKFNGFYKHYGANFQSFSLITTGVQQRSWMLKADQFFFQKKLVVMASIKENEYTNPFTTLSYQSNMVFKSIQATLRMPKWPVLSLGYYPSSQLTKLSDNSYTENLFYSLVANMSYYYKYHGVNMSFTAIYTRFYNQQTDSAFIYFNTSNLLYNHAVFYKKLTYQATASVAWNADYNLYTIDNDAQYALLDWLSLGAGIKYNQQTNYDIQQVGYKGMAIVKIKKLGEFQFMLDNGFIPGANRRLVANKTGRFSFFKLF